jgi:hypothetical protein
VASLGVDLPADLVFHSQVGDPQTGRPDLVATDEMGGERLIIEAKFWANLTDNQPGAYLTRLAPARPSLLLVVAPQVRLATLWTDLLINFNSAPTWRTTGSAPMAPPAPSDILDHRSVRSASFELARPGTNELARRARRGR